jgi:hypothetical protein
MIRYVACHDRARTYDRPRTDSQPGEDNSTDPHESARTDFHAPRNARGWGDVYAVGQPAFVIDAGIGIHDTSVTNASVSTHRCMSENL